MQSDVTLYAFPPSHCSQKVRLALAEKRVAYTNRFVDIEMRMQNYDPDYLALNPRGVVPTLVHDGRAVTDSATIVRYIDEAFDGPSLTPTDESELKAMEDWIDLQDRLRIRTLTFGTMGGPVGFLLRQISMPMRKRKLRKLRAQNPDLAEIYDFKLDDLQEWRSDIASAEDVARTRDEMGRALDRAASRLEESPYLAGATYSLADLVWTTVFARVKMLGLAGEFWGPTLRPAIGDYYDRLRGRESFGKAGVWESQPDAETRRALLRSVLSGSGETRVEA